MEPLAPGTEDDLESSQVPVNSKKASEQQRLLSIKAYLPSRTFGRVFELTYPNGAEHWYCHMCECPVMGRVYHHEIGKRHTSRVLLGQSLQQGYTGPVEEEADLLVAPGEPVPPGFEGKVQKVAEIQERLDNYHAGALLGLEYLVEIQEYDTEKEPSYLCLLCYKKGDPRTVIAHLGSYNHLCQFLQRHFPTCYRGLSPYMTKQYKRNWQISVTKIAEAIESQYGRLKPFPVDKDTFEESKQHYWDLINNGQHFSEKIGATFEELIDKDQLTKNLDIIETPVLPKQADEASKRSYRKTGSVPFDPKKRSPSPPVVPKPVKKSKPAGAPRKSRSLSSVSTISSSDLSDFEPDPKKKGIDSSRPRNRRMRFRSRSPRRSPRKRTRSPSPHRSGYRINNRDGVMPWQRSDYMRSRSEISVESRKQKNDKYEEFKKLATAIETDMEKTLKLHERNPEKHPHYSEEWKIFWNKRYKELQAEGKDPNTFDFKPEWIQYWNKRIGELHNTEMKNRKEALRKRLGLPEEPAPICFRITGKKKTGFKDDGSRKPAPIASLPDQDHEVIIIEDKDDDTKSSKRSHSPWEIESAPKLNLARKPRCRSRDRNRGKSPDRKRGKSRDRSRGKSRDRSRGKSKDRSRGRSQDRSRGRSQDRSRGRSQDRSRGKSRDRSRGKSRDRSRGKSTDRSRGKSRDKSRGKSREKNSNRSRESSWERVSPDGDYRGRDFRSRDYKPKDRSASSYSRDMSHERDMRYLFKKDIPDCYKPPPVMRDVTRQPVYSSVMQTLPESEDEGEINIVGVLRLLTALEEKLGSLGPKIIDLLAQALALEKNEANSSETLLDNEINCVLFETVKEKLKGQLLARLVDYMQEKAFKNAIKKIASLLHYSSERQKQKKSTQPDPVKVPGVGAVDKAAIAKQIATALVLQGKTDVTQAELEQLINAVVGMAEASRSSSKPVTTASFLEQLTRKKEESVSATPLQALQNSSNDSNSMEGLSESDLQTLLQNFKDLSTEEQHSLINYLKKLESKEPERVERLRKFVNMGGEANIKLEIKKTAGRISPFSSRLALPKEDDFDDFEEEPVPKKEKREEQHIPMVKINIDSEEEEYSYEDVFKVAAKNVNEKEEELRQQEEIKQKDVELNNAKAIIANLMGSIGSKGIQSFESKPMNLTDTSSFTQTLNNIPVNMENIANIMGTFSNLKPHASSSRSSQSPQGFMQNQSSKSISSSMGKISYPNVGNNKMEGTMSKMLGNIMGSTIGNMSSNLSNINPNLGFNTASLNPNSSAKSMQHMTMGNNNSNLGSIPINTGKGPSKVGANMMGNIKSANKGNSSPKVSINMFAPINADYPPNNNKPTNSNYPRYEKYQANNNNPQDLDQYDEIKADGDGSGNVQNVQYPLPNLYRGLYREPEFIPPQNTYPNRPQERAHDFYDPRFNRGGFNRGNFNRNNTYDRNW